MLFKLHNAKTKDESNQLGDVYILIIVDKMKSAVNQRYRVCSTMQRYKMRQHHIRKAEEAEERDWLSLCWIVEHVLGVM